MNNFERRKGNDRRKTDLGPPPGMEERRTSAERRIPEVQEQVLSEEEWDRYFSESSWTGSLLPQTL